jgi:hypothetical protein
MFVAQGPTQDPGTLMLITLLVVGGVVVFWRTVIKLMAIALLVLVVSGVLELLRSLH